MIHTDYTFYKAIFKGTVIPDETAFNSSVNEAIAYIDRLTRGKCNALDSCPDEVKMAVCAVAEIIYIESKSTVTSESVGNHSRTYAVTTQADRERDKIRKSRIYLSRTGLLYGGMS